MDIQQPNRFAIVHRLLQNNLQQKKNYWGNLTLVCTSTWMFAAEEDTAPNKSPHYQQDGVNTGWVGQSATLLTSVFARFFHWSMSSDHLSFSRDAMWLMIPCSLPGRYRHLGRVRSRWYLTWRTNQTWQRTESRQFSAGNAECLFGSCFFSLECQSIIQ